jgi:hypothetical protein
MKTSLGAKAGISFYYSILGLMFGGGVILLLLVGGILSIQADDPLNLILNEQTELTLFISVGIGLVTSPFWLVPYVSRILSRKQAIKIGINHHVRNRAQEILSYLEFLETSATTDEQLAIIRGAKASCFAMIESLSKVIQSDGDKIDYSLAMKEFFKDG